MYGSLPPVDSPKLTTNQGAFFKVMKTVDHVFVWNESLSTFFKVPKTEILHLAHDHWKWDLLITYKVSEYGLWIL